MHLWFGMESASASECVGGLQAGWGSREQERFWQGSHTGQLLHPQLSWSLQVDRSSNAVRCAAFTAADG